MGLEIDGGRDRFWAPTTFVSLGLDGYGEWRRAMWVCCKCRTGKHITPSKRL